MIDSHWSSDGAEASAPEFRVKAGLRSGYRRATGAGLGKVLTGKLSPIKLKWAECLVWPKATDGLLAAQSTTHLPPPTKGEGRCVVDWVG